MMSLAGFLVALAVGLTGVGGGVLLTPVLILAFGMPPAAAVGTALLFVTVVKLLAAPLYVMRRQVDYRAAGLLLAGGLPGAAAGVFVHRWFSRGDLRATVLALVGLTIVLLALIQMCRLLRRQASGASQKARRHWLAWIGLPIGIEVGFSSAGAGALGNLALMNCTQAAPAVVVGTDLVFGLALAAAAGGLHFTAGHVDAESLQALCLGGIPGALLGAGLAVYLPARPFRAALTLLMFGLGSRLLWEGLRGFVR
ncbi:MAG: sulfite exporter TauE/SafE family protein [Bryobacteraceae bacterium]